MRTEIPPEGDVPGIRPNAIMSATSTRAMLIAERNCRSCASHSAPAATISTPDKPYAPIQLAARATAETGSHTVPSGSQAKPVNSVARSHSHGIHTAANTSTYPKFDGYRAYTRHAMAAVIAGYSARYSDSRTTAPIPKLAGMLA